MKTPLQELIEDVKRMEQGLDVEELSAYVYKRATELLEMEREQIEEAYDKGFGKFKSSEQYYNETFNQNK